MPAERELVELGDADDKYDDDSATDPKKSKKKKWKHEDVGLKTHDDTSIIIPRGMSIDDLELVVRDIKQDLRQELTISEPLLAIHPHEAAVALMQAMVAKWGKAMPKSQWFQSFFGPYEEKPEMWTVQTDVDEWVQVPFGAFSIPGVKPQIVASVGTWKDGRFCLYLNATVRKSEARIVRELVDMARAVLKRDSIYKNGKALKVFTNAKGLVDLARPPEFFDPAANARPEDIILNARPQLQLDVVRGLLTHSEQMKQARVPTKYAVLSVGPYGTGKTESMLITAAIAVENKHTVINVENPNHLKQVLEIFARDYGPLVLIVEDLDRIVGSAADDLANAIDSVDLKGSRLLTLFTTNHLDAISDKMMRNGRIDEVVYFGAPDADTAGKLIEKYGRGLLAEDADIEEVRERLAGQVASTIQGVVERAKMAKVIHGHPKVTTEDLLYAVESHEALLKLRGGDKEEIDPDQQLGRSLRKALTFETEAQALAEAKAEKAAEETARTQIGELHKAVVRGR